MVTCKAKDLNGNYAYGFYFEKEGSSFIVQDNDFVEVQSDTMQMCTGLQDCNGSLIYDGDVIKGYEMRIMLGEDCAESNLITVVQYKVFFDEGTTILHNMTEEDSDVPAYYMLTDCEGTFVETANGDWGLGEGVEPSNWISFPSISPNDMYKYELVIE